MSKGAVIAIIFVVLLLIIFVVIGVVAASSGSSQSGPQPNPQPTGGYTQPSPQPTGGYQQPAPQPSACSLNCNDGGVLSSAQNYYNTQGEWKGVFTMSPIRSVSSGANQCDILYQYNPTPGSPRTDTGQDKRRFTFAQGPNCTWNVSSMGGFQSGTSV